MGLAVICVMVLLGLIDVPVGLTFYDVSWAASCWLHDRVENSLLHSDRSTNLKQSKSRTVDLYSYLQIPVKNHCHDLVARFSHLEMYN